MSTSIVLPALVEGALTKLTDPRPQADADFVTKKGNPVDAVCVDHSIIETSKATPAVRLLFVVVSGQDDQGNDVKGRNIVTDKYLSGNAAPYTFADLRLMGWTVVDGKEAEALAALTEGDLKTSGLGAKVVRVDLKNETFNNQPTIRVGGISQPPQRLTGVEVKTKLASGLLEAIKKSKEGRPAQTDSASKSGSQPRNPTSPPPAVQRGTVTADEDLPF